MFLDFVKALLRDWIAWTSGLVGVLLWIAGFIADSYALPNWSKSSFWWGATIALFFSFYSVWREEHEKLSVLEKRLNGLPKLRLVEHGFHADEFYTAFVRTGITGRQPVGEPHSVLRLRVRNDPESSTAESVARGVRADVCFYSEAGQKLLEIDGRWSDSH